MNTPVSHSLRSSLRYLAEVVRTRLQLYFGLEARYPDIGSVPAPDLEGEGATYADFLRRRDFSTEEQLMLLMALAPHLQPNFFDEVIAGVLPNAGDFPQLGGVRGQQHRGFLPTAETALFVLAGDDLEQRFAMQVLLQEDHPLIKQGILRLEPPKEGEPAMSGLLTMDQEYIDLFTLGKVTRPRFGMNFPARRIETQMEWEDLVLNGETMAQIRELEAWVKHGHTLLHDWGLSRRLGAGYRALFHGPPGTGKTLTASLLGKYTGKDVYKIDLSLVVSKYIGETEKNLANLFAKAEHKDWILFFDEADALFGKRTSVKDAHDRYANQEVSYLLQRVETYDGLVILASNFKSNIDEAFVRRFQSIIHFPMPRAQERLRLWQAAFPDEMGFESGVDFRVIAQKYELSGASIMNVVQHCCLQALAAGATQVSLGSLEAAIKREFAKEGKIL